MTLSADFEVTFAVQSYFPQNQAIWSYGHHRRLKGSVGAY